MPAFSDYRAPDLSTSEDTRAGWHREVVQAGQQWLSVQKPFKGISEARKIILDKPEDDLPAEMSTVKVAGMKRQIRELVSILSNLKSTASIRTNNKPMYDQATMLNKLDMYWWHTCGGARSFRPGFQAAAVDGTAYLSHVWDPDLRRRGVGDIRTDVFAADEVYLIQPPKDFNLQKCYAVVMKRRMPIFQVQAAYPTRAHEIVPDHGSKAWTQKGLDYVQSFMSSPLKNLGGVVNAADDFDEVWPTVDVYDTYIMDLSINVTGSPVQMGKPGTSWEYTVPSFGSDVLTGTNGWEGLPLYRKATIEDARLYPLRRRMVATEHLILDDGSSPWWHGQVPLARIRFDDWWCEALGFSLTWDAKCIEQDNTELMRGISDAAKVRLGPPMAYDENLVSERLAERLNPRQPRQMLKLNMQMGEAIKPILPPNYADLPNYITDWSKHLDSRQEWVMGVRDLVSMAKAKQIPSSDAIEKILEMAGPLAQDMTMGIEQAMTELGEMRRYLNMQYRPLSRRLAILGATGADEKDFDYDPATLIPSHLETENPEAGPSRFSMVERARKHAEQFYYYVVPGSLARLQQMSHKLLLLQLAKSGLLPLAPWTVAKLFEIDGYGESPLEAETMWDEYVDYQRLVAGLQQEGAAVGPQKQRGRPASGNASPQLKSKDGGQRSTVATSR